MNKLLPAPGLVLPSMDLRGAFVSDPSFARGYNAEGDVITQTIDGRDLNQVWAEFQRSLNLFNRQRQILVDLLTFSVQSPIEDVPIYTGDDFEEASEYGEPKGLRGGDYFSMGYDFKWYDLAVRYTWKFLAEATAAQVDNLNQQALEADNRLVFRRIMWQLFNNVNRTAEIRKQNVTVFSFYNADGTVPPRFKNNVFDGTHQHYITSGAATIDSGDLDASYEHLRHHGYSTDRGMSIITLVNPAQATTIRTFRVATGSTYDFIPASGQPPFLLPTNTGGIQGGQAPAQFAGFNVIGSYGPQMIIEEDYVPAGYYVTFATGGEDNIGNPIGIREHQNTGLRGLRLVKGRDNDYPLIDSFYQRGFGVGVRHRGATVVTQITAAGAYTRPTTFD